MGVSACAEALAPGAPTPAATSFVAPAVPPHVSVSAPLPTSTDWSGTRAELEALYDADQAGRQRAWDEQQRAQKEGHPMTEEQKKQSWAAGEALDADNLQKLDAIVAQRGWPPVHAVGDKAALAAFLIVQHAPLGAQKRYLPILRVAAAANETRADYLAMLEDRVNLADGKAQSYGSQATGKGGVVTLVTPVEDPAHIDERRAKVGLPPICEYLRGFDAGPVVWPSCVTDAGVDGSFARWPAP